MGWMGAPAACEVRRRDRQRRLVDQVSHSLIHGHTHTSIQASGIMQSIVRLYEHIIVVGLPGCPPVTHTHTHTQT